MQAVYRRWVGLNKCLASALFDDDANDVVRCISPYAGELKTEERMRLGLHNIVLALAVNKGRSVAAKRRSIGYKHQKVKRVFTGEALWRGLKLDLTLGEEQTRRKFSDTSNLSRASKMNFEFMGGGNMAIMDMKGDLQGWCELKDTFFQDLPEILTELTVFLAKSVPDVGTFRAFLDCTSVSVDEPNLEGTKSSASAKNVNVVVSTSALYKRGRINPLSLFILPLICPPLPPRPSISYTPLGTTPLMAACSRLDDASTPMIQLLLERGANAAYQAPPSSLLGEGILCSRLGLSRSSPIKSAAGEPEFLRLLIDAGATLDAHVVVYAVESWCDIIAENLGVAWASETSLTESESAVDAGGDDVALVTTPRRELGAAWNTQNIMRVLSCDDGGGESKDGALVTNEAVSDLLPLEPVPLRVAVMSSHIATGLLELLDMGGDVNAPDTTGKTSDERICFDFSLNSRLRVLHHNRFQQYSLTPTLRFTRTNW